MRAFIHLRKITINKHYFKLFLILLLTFTIRAIYLNKFPIGITHDELNYIISAKSLFWTKSFAPGTAPALFPTQISNYTVTVAEIPALILSSFVGPLDLSLFTSRLIGPLLSTTIVLAVYLLTKQLTKNNKIALISCLLMAINPWSVLMGRTAFEVNFYVAFFLWGLIVLNNNQGWRIFYSFPFFLLGFLSYTGGQVSFFLFIILALFFNFITINLRKKQKLVYFSYFCLITLVFLIYISTTLHNQSFTSRGKELYTPFRPEISETVNYERRLSLYNITNKYFINKATIYLSGFFEKYLNTFSVNNLFINGELRASYSFQKHGTFYIIDFLFILIGLSYLFQINKRVWAFVLATLAICSITSGLNIVEYSYSQRAGLIFPFLVILSGIGIAYLINSSSLRILKKLIIISIIIIYFISFINLLHIYFFRFPIYASDGWFLEDRVLSRYITLAKEKNPGIKINIITNEPKIIFEEYLYFTSSYQGKQVQRINTNLDQQNYSWNNVFFTNSCPENNSEINTIYIFTTQIKCQENNQLKKPLRITRIKDALEYYLIFNDEICQNKSLNSYLSPSNFENFSVEKMKASEFCQKWITKLSPSDKNI